jgi:voltage-gated potassium channel Kch
MSRRYTVRQRLRYALDNSLARGLWVVLLWLAGITVAVIMFVAGLIWLLRTGPDDEPTSFADGLWLAIGRYLDAGTFTGDSGSSFRFLALGVTIVGLFIGAALIGLIANSIDTRIDELRRGQSLVVESGHTLILGASDKLPVVISELIEANRSERAHAIVVLSGEDTIELAEEINKELGDRGNSRIVFRRGDPAQIADLERMAPQDARSVIVLREDDAESSAKVVKVVLALNRILGPDATQPIVAEIEDDDTATALTELVGPRLLVLDPTYTVARITAQASRQPGLGAIYQELLDFGGDEMYFIDIPDHLVGRTYGELLMSSSRSTIVGVQSSDGTVALNPRPTTVIDAGKRLIGISADDSTFRLDLDPAPWQPPAGHRFAADEVHVERTLIVGWSDVAPLVMRELESHVADGSTIVMLVDEQRQDTEALARRIDALNLRRQRVEIRTGNTIARATLAALVAEERFSHFLILCERNAFDIDEADSRVLLTMLHLRSTGSVEDRNVVAELMDPRDVELAAGAESDDFIVSQRLVSLLLAQLSESPHLADVFDDLFTTDGATISLQPFDRFSKPGAVTFGDIVAEARNWGSTAIGYRARSARHRDDTLADGLRINPPKDEVVEFAPGDCVVMLTHRVRV